MTAPSRARPSSAIRCSEVSPSATATASPRPMPSIAMAAQKPSTRRSSDRNEIRRPRSTIASLSGRSRPWMRMTSDIDIGASRLQLEHLLGGLAHKLRQHVRTEVQVADLIHRLLEIEHRKIGAEHHLILAEGVDVVDQALRPVLRRMRIGSDVDVGMLQHIAII